MTEVMRIAIDTTDDDFSIQLPLECREFKFIQPSYLHFNLNFNNIQASFGNNILYLNNAGTQSITLSDGCYDVGDINALHLQNVLFTKYFKIHDRFDGQGLGLYSYASVSDRNTYTNATLITFAGGLNSEIQYGEFRPTMIKLVSQMWHIHASSKANLRDGRIFIPCGQG